MWHNTAQILSPWKEGRQTRRRDMLSTPICLYKHLKRSSTVRWLAPVSYCVVDLCQLLLGRQGLNSQYSTIKETKRKKCIKIYKKMSNLHTR